METKIELTPDEYKLLQFIGQHVGGRSDREFTEFTKNLSSKTYLVAKGLVEQEPRMNGVILYRVNDKGRKLLNLIELTQGEREVLEYLSDGRWKKFITDDIERWAYNLGDKFMEIVNRLAYRGLVEIDGKTSCAVFAMRLTDLGRALL